jgi:hypothetical protein
LSLSLRFPYQNSVYASPLPLTRYMSRPSHSSRFYHPKSKGGDYRSLSSSLCTFIYSCVTSSLLGLSNTISLRSSLNVSDQVSHPFKTTGKIIVLSVIYDVRI